MKNYKNLLIGISANICVINEEHFDGYEYVNLSDKYVKAILDAGAYPIVVPVIDDDEAIKSIITKIDALVLSGGQDVNPKFYNEDPLEKLGNICTRRDEFDFKLIKYAMELKKPILGICRGMQILNVYFGGNLYQDLSYCKNYFVKHDQNAKYYEATHSLHIKEDSFLYDIADKETFVNSFHHQAIRKLANDFKVIARAKDEVIEAIEYMKEDNFILAVQFHPEMMFEKHEFSRKIFKSFIEHINKI